ncbi:MAG: hypothetical protein ACRCZ9_12295 [Fusobacteriaceae bacterium]
MTRNMVNKKVKRTISEFIDQYKNEEYITFISGLMDETISLHFMDIYKFHFEDNSVHLTLSTKEIEIYRCHPKKLSQTLYGTPDLWFILMYINKISHPGDFTLEGDVLIMGPSAIPLMTRLYSAFRKSMKYDDNTNAVV